VAQQHADRATWVIEWFRAWKHWWHGVNVLDFQSVLFLQVSIRKQAVLKAEAA
jgi:hypothetical protein